MFRSGLHAPALLLVMAALSSAERVINWGIIGTGAVAHDFATVLNACDGCQVKAVGSRTAESAERFGEAHGIPVRYGSYEELVNDAEIDIVYIASPSKVHVEHSELCLNAAAEEGRHPALQKPSIVRLLTQRDSGTPKRQHRGLRAKHGG